MQNKAQKAVAIAKRSPQLFGLQLAKFTVNFKLKEIF